MTHNVFSAEDMSGVFNFEIGVAIRHSNVVNVLKTVLKR